MVCLRIPILRRLRCGGRIIPPIFLLVTDTFNLHFHFRIINQIFSTLRLISNIFWWFSIICRSKSPVSFTAFTVSSSLLVASTIALPCSSNCSKRESKLQAILLLLCNTRTEWRIWVLKRAFIVFKGIDLHWTPTLERATIHWLVSSFIFTQSELTWFLEAREL